MIVTWLLLRVWGSTQAEPNLCRWICSPECSSVFGTAWWPQNIGPVLTQQWRWLRSRHWFPGGSRAGSLPQQSEHRGEADRRRSGLLEGGIGTFLQLYNSFVLPAVTLCMFYVSMLTKCANSFSRRYRIWQRPVLDPTSVSEHCEQRIRNERAEIFIKTRPCSSSTEVSHSSFPPVLGFSAGIFSIALDSCQRSPGSTETTWRRMWHFTRSLSFIHQRIMCPEGQ